ncbi:MAG: hypothetical protein WA885_20670 [Phormidesmis sp.]
MVSPLQIWRHAEPRGLWPALGGLAVLTHVGVIGMSLPYVMELMQSSGESAVVPVELIVVDAADESVAEQPIEQPIQTSAQAAASASADIPTETENASSTPIEQSTKTLSPEVPPPLPITPEESNPAAQSPTPPAGTEPPSSPEPSDPAPNQTPSANGSGESDEPTPPSEEPVAPSEPATIEGESALPLPGAGDGAAQATSFSVVAATIEPIQDLKEEPPQLLSRLNQPVELQSSQRCGRLSFTQQRLTYRLAIDADGSIRTVTLQPEGGSLPVSGEEDEAIACLIRSAGLAFEPAKTDGTPQLDDSLLLTVEVIESQLREVPE